MAGSRNVNAKGRDGRFSFRGFSGDGLPYKRSCGTSSVETVSRREDVQNQPSFSRVALQN